MFELNQNYLQTITITYRLPTTLKKSIFKQLILHLTLIRQVFFHYQLTIISNMKTFLQYFLEICQDTLQNC